MTTPTVKLTDSQHRRITAIRQCMTELSCIRDTYAPDCLAYVNITLAIRELEATISAEGKGWTE
jgi:hypothetical protein